MTADFLSRLQFTFTVSFHIIFPAFSIGLATFLAIMEGTWLKTKNPLYLNICKFWDKIFALTFGMGVVSGVIMEFQFGTNWAGFSGSVGEVLGALFTYEVMTAFFIEAGFLGVMIFGWDRVGPKLHFISTLMVCLGVNLSALWIIAANSWMQYPAGAQLVGGKFVATDWWQIVLNPMMPYRLLHMLIAAYTTTAVVIAGIAGHYLLSNSKLQAARKCLAFAVIALLVLMPTQILIGDEVGLKVHKYQPIKTAAIEGLWDTTTDAPFLMFAIPDQELQKNWLEIKIPYVASILNTHNLHGELQGLKSVPPADQPVVSLTFFSFRVMLLAGLVMLLIGLLGTWYLIRGKLYETTWFLKSCRFFAPVGFFAVIAGWFTAESGRQPWIVYNKLRTTEMASAVSVEHVLISLMLLVIVYGIIFGIFYFKYFFKTLGKGMQDVHIEKTDQPFQYLEIQD